MGLSFRKSVRFGPMRVNFSSSGIGYSVGVKGARVGMNKRGTYVSMGAGGIQYKKYLHSSPSQGGHYVPQPSPQLLNGQPHTITSDDINQISDVDSQNFIDELAEKAAKIPFAKWGTLALAVLLGLSLLSYFRQVTREEKFITPKVEITTPSGLKIRQQPDKASSIVGSAAQGTMLSLTDSTLKHWYEVEGGFVSKKFARITQVASTKQYIRAEEHPNWFGSLAAICAMLVLGVYIYLARLDKARMTLAISYEFNDELAKIHQDFLQAFGQVLNSHKVWQYLHSERVTDKRRHSGADNSITRVPIGSVAANRKPSVHLETNVPIPYLGLRNTELFFFPERLVVKRGREFAAIFYKNLSLQATNSQFIEEQAVPNDATVVGTTWKFLNKNGTPDRRFNNNREIPLCRYSQYTFRSNTGIYEVITTSKNGSLDLFTKYIAAIGELQQRLNVN